VYGEKERGRRYDGGEGKMEGISEKEKRKKQGISYF
jgi:hypothetical protein